MPELPEVETTRRGLEPHCVGHRLLCLRVREPRLRWHVPVTDPPRVAGARIHSLDRRGKYLLFRLEAGTTILMHLGMSGHMRVVRPGQALKSHDHVDFELDSGELLRFNDPRRFGSLHITEDPPEQHPLLSRLGPEPLGGEFRGEYLHRIAAGRRVAIKNLVMDSHVVVGVGNIYATEALYRAGIHPTRPAGRIARQRYDHLVGCIRAVLEEAIEAGGTTLRDFSGADGVPGYFQQTLHAYGRGGQPCGCCGRRLKEIRLAQRSTVYCPRCQR
ncbi:bifunctional DNA-formamidopyrimidine glycosylase/DNA-(apurinic or apyrimidinic site) lyase [Spiribacter sp. 221]|uniref:bifunctional DNA-formamidopyrimidine glycosylase/DNA-(apurinic or apyrimidinic site) lyase n=1 Tax=Spiribacter onubensis TaxID=3122420 RepID=UPI00349F3D1E